MRGGNECLRACVTTDGEVDDVGLEVRARCPEGQALSEHATPAASAKQPASAGPPDGVAAHAHSRRRDAALVPGACLRARGHGITCPS